MQNYSVEASNASITVSLVSYSEHPHQLLGALKSVGRSLRAAARGGLISEYRVVIVNNRDERPIELDRIRCELDSEGVKPENISVIEGQGNIGYGRGQNLAFSDNNLRYHLYMNPDVEVEVDALEAGIRYLETHPSVGIVSPRAVDADDNKQHLCKTFPSLFTLFLRSLNSQWINRIFSKRLGRYEMHYLQESSPTPGIPIVSGCFMLCRTRLMKEIGGFDSEYFLYFEDFDLSIRASKKAEIAYLPSMRIKHFGGGAAKKGWIHILIFVRSALKFFTEYGWRWTHQD